MTTKGNFVLAGSSDTGKTTYKRNRILPGYKEAGKTILTVDVEDEYNDVVEVKKPENIPEAMEKHQHVRIVPDTKPPTSTDNRRYNGKILDEIIRHFDRFPEKATLDVAEAHNFQTPHKMFSGRLYTMMKQGDKYQKNVVQESQEPQDFNRASWNNGGDIIVFPLRELPKKLKRLLNGQDPTSLPEYHYYHIPAIASKDIQEYPPIQI